MNETVGLTVRQTVFKLAVQMITAAGTAAVIGVGAYQAVQGEITAGELLVVLSYISQIYLPLEELTNTITSFQQWFINLLMSFDLMDMEPEVKQKRDAVPLSRARAEIELEDVGFGYAGPAGGAQGHLVPDPGRSIRWRSSARPEPASRHSSSLVPRFYDPNEGMVRLDGHDVRDLQARRPPQPVQHRAPGAAAVLGHDRLQHPLRNARRLDRGGDRGGEGRERPRLHLGAARRLRDGARGAGGEDLRRRAPARSPSLGRSSAMLRS